MKKMFFIIISLFAILGFAGFVVSVSEPYYLSEIVGNTESHQNFDEYTKELNLNQQSFILGNFTIDTNSANSYFVIGKDKISSKPLIISVVTGSISYRLFEYNKDFNSIFSPAKIAYIDNSTILTSGTNNFDCIKIENHQTGIDIPDKCKSIPTFEDKYPELRLEIYGRSGTVINFQQ